MIHMPETDLYGKALSLGVPPDLFVVVGSGAIEAVVGPDVRRGSDLDIVLSGEAYDALRNSHGLEEIVQADDGYRSLQGNGFDLARGVWYGRSFDQLHSNGYTHNGVRIAGLPDTYGVKSERMMPKDERDLEIIRNRLHGPEPLPQVVIRRELDYVLSCMPERLRDPKVPELHVAANGLYTVLTLFGHETGRWGHNPRYYRGEIETHGVLATFHGYEHTAAGMQEGQLNLDELDRWRQQQGLPPIPDQVRYTVVAGFGAHDAGLGNGRMAVNPERHDERQCAERVVQHLCALGVTDKGRLAGANSSVMVTAYNEATNSQFINPLVGHLTEQHTNAGADMCGFIRREGARRAAALVIEDGFREGAGYDRPLGRLVDQLNAERAAQGAPPIRVTTEEGYRLIDEYPDFLVTYRRPGAEPETMTLREYATRHLRGSASFCRNYKYPKRWVRLNPGQQAKNADSIAAAADTIEQGGSAAEAYQRLSERTGQKQKGTDLPPADYAHESIGANILALRDLLSQLSVDLSELKDRLSILARVIRHEDE